MSELKSSVLELLKDGEIRAAIAQLFLDAAQAIAPPKPIADDLDYTQIIPYWTVGALKQQLETGGITPEEYNERLSERQELQERTLSNMRRAQTGQFTYSDSLWLDVLSKMLKKSKGAIISTAYITYLRRNRPEHVKQLRAIQAKEGLDSLEETFTAILEDRIQC